MSIRSYKKLYGLLFLGMIVCSVLYYLRTRERFQDAPSSMMDVVVARYEEDISWIKNIPENLYRRILIYNKGGEAEFDLPKSNVKTLPNLGRESHTYLHHVIENYDSLADITLFLPGSAWTRGDKRERVERIVEYLKTNKTSIIIGHKDDKMINDTYNFSIDTWTVTNAENRSKNPDSSLTPSVDRPLRNWFEKRFDGISMNCVSFTGIIAVSRDDIRKRPKEFYEELYKEHSHTNPEVVHYSERVWKNIFSIDDDKCFNQ
jgi:hypothetical protein